MKNPVAQIREDRGLSRPELALMLGVSYDLVAAVENGRRATPGPTLAERLQRLGYDPKKVAQDYRAWRQQQQEQLLAAAVG